MATDIYCPHQDCKNIRKSGLCDRSVISLESSNDDALACTDYQQGDSDVEGEDDDLH